MRPCTCRLAAILVTSTAIAQSTWVNANPATRPSQRCCPGLASDLVSNRIWLFSGGTIPPYPNDTWSWNGTTWTQHFPATIPGARSSHAMVYDVARNRVVMFGGSPAPFSNLDETWEWDGTNWTQLTLSPRPPARAEHGMAYDLARARTVLFSGNNAAADTWTFDGSAWTQLTPPVTPSARRGHAMAWHTATGKVVLFGGSAGGDETWEWDGTTWLPRTPAVRPSPRTYFGMCEDAARGRIVVFSGTPVGPADTWEWDGDTWSQRQPVTTLPGRSATAMAFDRVSTSPLLFGGNNSGTRFNETWLFQASTASFTPFGAGCPGSAGTAALTAATNPWLGQSWSLRLAPTPASAATMIFLGLSNTTWNTTPLPMALATFGMPGCVLLISPDVGTLVLAQNGAATLPVAVPNIAALSGLNVFAQGLVLDPAVNAAGAVVSSAGHAVLAGL